VLVFSGILAIMIIFIVVVPNFAGILEQGNQDVPWLGQAVISTGVWFNAHLMYVGLGALALVIGVTSLATNPRVRQQATEWLARLPVVGSWLVESETGRWATTMSALLENRIELVQAMELARRGIRFEFLRARLSQVTKAVRAGSSLADALAQASAITSMGCDLVRVGERTGALPSLLKSLGRLYDTTSRERMTRTVQLIEPLAILIIGGFIGLIITGVMLAITASQDIGI
jgi:general secretion pathway protein F